MRLTALFLASLALAGCDQPTLSTRGVAPGGALCADGSAALTRISGQIRDDVGIPAARALVQLCGADGCSRPAATDFNGQFALDLPADGGCAADAVLQVMQSGSATSYCDLPTHTGGAIELQRPLMVHRTAPALEVPLGGGSVEFAGGITMEADPTLVDSVGYQQLAARLVDPAKVCNPRQFDGMIAFAPEMDVRGSGFDLHIQTYLPALTTVALFVRGGAQCSLTDGHRPGLAQWHDYGTGIVDEAGILHATGPNALPCLGWLAWHILEEGEGGRLPPEVDLPPVDPEPDTAPNPEPSANPEPEGEPDVAPPGEPQPDPDTLPRPGPPNVANAPEFRAVDAPADNGVPIIELLEPADGAIHLANDAIEVVARITDGVALSGSFLVWAVNGERYPCPTNGDDIACVVDGDLYRWTITVGAAGPRAFSVSARNDRGRVTRTPERIADVRVSLDAKPPRVVILDPTPDTTWRANTTVTIQTRITDDGPVEAPELQWEYNNNTYPCPHQSQYVDCTVDGDRYTWFVQVGTGTRAFQIAVSDAEGNTTLTPRRSLELQ